MPALSYKGALCTGHGAFPPRPSITGSENVFVNDIPVLRNTDSYDVHSNGIVSHDSVVSGGSGTVFVNDLKAARIGDDVACGGTVSEGSSNVFSG